MINFTNIAIIIIIIILVSYMIYISFDICYNNKIIDNFDTTTSSSQKSCQEYNNWRNSRTPDIKTYLDNQPENLRLIFENAAREVCCSKGCPLN